MRAMVNTCIPKILEEAYMVLPEVTRGILGDVAFPADGGKEICEELRKGELICASDGSVKDGIGAYAYSIL